MLALAAIAALSSYFTVAPYERTVVTRAGAFSYVADPGLHFKLPFADSTFVERVDIQQVTTPKLNVYTVDNQEVDATIGYSYRVPFDEVRFTFENNRGGGKLEPLLIDRVKVEIGKVNVTEIANKRGELVRSIRDSVAAEAKRLYHLDVIDVQLLNLDYQDSFRNAQAQAAVVKTQIEQSEGLKTKAKVDAETAKIVAIGQANQAIEAARGAAESQLLQARSQAESIRVQGEAQAAAQELMAKALTASPALVELRRAERWNGQLPVNVYAGAPIPFLQSGSK